MGILFVLLAAFFFHTEGVVSSRKDDAKIKESAERVRKSIWCGPRGCFLDLGMLFIKTFREFELHFIVLYTCTYEMYRLNKMISNDSNTNSCIHT